MGFKLKSPAVLLLEDGTAFHGRSNGIPGTTTGEICFNTSMTGYQEIFTDPSYYGQILVNTAVHIGNYGVLDAEVESGTVKIAGLVCKDFSDMASRRNGNGTLQEYFEKNKIVAISDVDTRALVRHIRNKGAMNAIISSETTDIEVLKQKLAEVPSMKGLELSSKVSTTEPYFYGDASAPYRVAVMDLGIKENILRCLSERGCYCKVYPMDATPEQMADFAPHGYMISNGPGDPEALPEVIKTIKTLIDTDKTLFGICLGHQVISLAMGIPTYKMFNGHRGANHPIQNQLSGKGEITSQNHGFVADMEKAKASDQLEITHVHLNDGSLAGFRVKGKKVFSVQYHPEASAGPHDSRYLFDEFVALLKN